jgi:K+ transporter
VRILSTPDIQGTAVFIADELNNIPFYIHHLIAKLKLRGGSGGYTSN